MRPLIEIPFVPIRPLGRSTFRPLRRLVCGTGEEHAGGSDREVAGTLEDEHLLVTAEQVASVLELHEAIARIEEEQAWLAQAVELHYSGGLTQEEMAGVLGVSRPTVTRDLRFAVTWLAHEWRVA